MNKQNKRILGVGIFVVVLCAVIVLLHSQILAFLSLQVEDLRHSGTWEDDSKNWYRAFQTEQPEQVKVVHSKYWQSSHFTKEFMYYFETEATPEWKDGYLKSRGLIQVSSSEARSFRTNAHSDQTPDWFAPDPVELYDVWDQPGYFGAVWINKTNGHMFFYEWQL
jgi:hypothetical protein